MAREKADKRIAELEAERPSLDAELAAVGLMAVCIERGKLAVAIQPGSGAAKLREAFKL